MHYDTTTTTDASKLESLKTKVLDGFSASLEGKQDWPPRTVKVRDFSVTIEKDKDEPQVS